MKNFAVGLKQSFAGLRSVVIGLVSQVRQPEATPGEGLLCSACSPFAGFGPNSPQAEQ